MKTVPPPLRSASAAAAVVIQRWWSGSSTPGTTIATTSVHPEEEAPPVVDSASTPACPLPATPSATDQTSVIHTCVPTATATPPSQAFSSTHTTTTTTTTVTPRPSSLWWELAVPLVTPTVVASCEPASPSSSSSSSNEVNSAAATGSQDASPPYEPASSSSYAPPSRRPTPPVRRLSLRARDLLEAATRFGFEHAYDDDDDDSYPNLTRHGSSSILAQHLTPEVYYALQHLQTSKGVTLEDCIRAGTALPWGAKPPRGVGGVYAGDAESYTLFAPLFDPIIYDHHHHRSVPEPKRATQQKQQHGGGGGRRRQRHVTTVVLDEHVHPHDEQYQEGETLPSPDWPTLDKQKNDNDDSDSSSSSSSGRRRPRRGLLQRHRTNLDPEHLVQQQIDPDGQYILSTRLRLARSLQGFRFSPCITRAERRAIERLVRECCDDWKPNNNNKGYVENPLRRSTNMMPFLNWTTTGSNSSSNQPASSSSTTTPPYTSPTGKYVSAMELTNAQHDDLIRRRILYPDPDAFALLAGTHRDWPDARGLYCDTWDDVEIPSIMLWCNMEDHVWIISQAKGGNVQDVFVKLSAVASALEVSLRKRGHQFVEDDRLGFLNTNPANLGTAFRASFYVKLVRLGKLPGFEDVVRRLRLEARAEYPQNDRRYTGIFDIANLEALGSTEVELINVMIDGVGRLIQLEKRLENGEELDLSKEY